MKHIYIINELNFWGMLFRALARGCVYIYKVEPLLKFAHFPIQLAVTALIKTGLAQDLKVISPKTKWINDLPIEYLSRDLYSRTVCEMERHFVVAPKFPRNSEYIYSGLKVMDYYEQQLVTLIHLTDWLCELLPTGSWRIIGLKRDYPVVHKIAHGAAPAFQYRLVPRINLLTNVIMFIGLRVYALIWLTSRIRWSVNRKTYFLAADSWAAYDKRLFELIVDDSNEILIFQRDASHAERDRDVFVQNQKCMMQDGRLTPIQALAMSRSVFSDTRMIWNRWKNADPMIFFLMTSMPIKRAMYTAFFNRFSVRYFWGRDDYAVDHILRNQELRKIGGTSLGINHGLPIYCYDPPWRHVDFDIYYSFGRHLYEKYNKNFWNPDMVNRPIGAIRLNRDQLDAPRAERNKDIVYFVNPRSEWRFYMNEVFKIARHFPDRKVLVKIKPSRRLDGVCADEIEMLKSSPQNVQDTQDDSYDLMLGASYAVSTGSTVVVEALQHRMKTFVFDGKQNGEFFYYRDFPSLCVQTGEEIIRRIEDIEAGREYYCFEDYADLVDMSGRHAVDVIREDMGLPPVAAEVAVK